MADEKKRAAFDEIMDKPMEKVSAAELLEAMQERRPQDAVVQRVLGVEGAIEVRGQQRVQQLAPRRRLGGRVDESLRGIVHATLQRTHRPVKAGPVPQPAAPARPPLLAAPKGPHARVGQVLNLPFERPRQRAEVLEHPLYYDMRGCLVEFLEEQEHVKQPQIAAPDDPAPSMIDTKVDIPVLDLHEAGELSGVA